MHNIRLPSYIFICILTIQAYMEGIDGSVNYDVRSGQEQNEKIIPVKYFQLSTQERLSLFMSEDLQVNINYSLPCLRQDDSYDVAMTSSDTTVFQFLGNTSINVSCRQSNFITKVNNLTVPEKALAKEYIEYTQGNFELSIQGNLLGLAFLNITTNQNKSNDVIIREQFQVYVLRPVRLVDTIFRVVVVIFFFILFIAFGCKLELEVVKECLKKPIAPGIGLACQYLLMPLIGYGVATLMPIDDKSIRLGIFLCGVCPGGGISNIYTYLLGGDVSLSVTMTFISTVASIGFMPLWVYTLGRTFMDEKINLTIPFLPLIQTIALATVPVLIGVLIKYKCERVAKMIIKVLKPVTVVFVILFFVVGIISNMYLFKLFKPMDFLAGCLLPYIGFILGGVIAAICQQSWTRVKTISLEAGMQNIGVAFILLLWAFPPPLGDIATLAPAANGMMTPLPGLIIAIPYNIYRKYHKKYEPVETAYSDKLQNGNVKKHPPNAVEVEKLSSV